MLAVCAGVAVVVALFGVSVGADHRSTNSVDSESTRGSALFDARLPQGPPSFVLVAGSPTLRLDDAGFRSALDAVLAPLRTDADVIGVTTPYTP